MLSENIEKIGALFPNCITEGIDSEGNLKKGINFELLKQNLSEDILKGNEIYEFTWPGKKKAIVEANIPTTKGLVPVLEDSKDWNTTENFYIEGDNLDVLKILQEEYLGKVKMVYIDPPYNTGHNFIYHDKFDCSTWCSMIYSRLLLTRSLLKETGIIAISINDKEVKRIRNIADEIFREDNFVCCFIWNTKASAKGMVTSNMVVSNHEYILIYAKDITQFKFRGLDRDNLSYFSNPDKDPRGLWKRQYLQRIGQGFPVRTIVDPNTGNSFSFETPYTQEKLNKWIQENRIIFPTDPAKYPARKEFLAEYANKQQLVTSLGLFATKATTEKLYNLFDKCKIFTNPKPEALIKFLIEQCVDEGIILDFFSGSATTAHAVIQLNAEDGENRKFIMVQIPEPCDEKSEAFKAGYTNICEIGKERIRRAGEKIKEEYPDAKDLDIGFRVYKVESKGE